MNIMLFYLTILFMFIGVQIIHILGSKNRLLDALKFDINDAFLDIVIPIALSFIFVGVFSQMFGVNIVASEYPIHILISYIGLLAPISEEIIFRGILLGMPLTVLGVSKNRWDIWVSVILLQALFFAVLHNNPSFLSFMLRWFLGLICGSLYYLRDRNILPRLYSILRTTGY